MCEAANTKEVYFTQEDVHQAIGSVAIDTITPEQQLDVERHVLVERIAYGD
jgi:hypothetical protein